MSMLRPFLWPEVRGRFDVGFQKRCLRKKHWNWIAGVALVCLLSGLSTALVAQVDCVSPTLKLPSECGIVTDMRGAPIAGATVSEGLGDVGSFVKTDERGRWGFLSDEKRSGWLRVEAKGFRTAEFKYSTTGKSINACHRPVYIRLVTGLDGCPVATLHENEGIKK